MNSLFFRFFIILIGIIYVPSIVHSQTHYYKLIKKIDNGVEYTNTAGGQYITFEDDKCFDSDKNGISVNNGILVYSLENSGVNIKTYLGNSYFGNAIYRFKSDLSVLNVIVNKNLIYVYRRVTPDTDIFTCTLIKKNRSSIYSSSHDAVPITGTEYTNQYNSSNSQNNSVGTQRQKTKVRKKCAYCNGKGERIQHESVATFGLDGPRVYCSKCNQFWSYGTVHAHHKCSHCNGTGYYEYEY